MIHTVINKYKNEEGSGLVLSLMVLLALSVLGSALGIVTVGSHRLADINRDSTSAYYIAEAGANMAYEEIKAEVETLGDDPTKQGTVFIKDVDDLLKDIDLTYDGETYFVKQSGQYPEVLIEIINETELNKDENIYSKEYIIRSTGNVDGKERTVNKPFEVSWAEKQELAPPIEVPEIPNNYAIISNEFDDQTSNFTINGEKRINEVDLSPYKKLVNNFPQNPEIFSNITNFSSDQSELSIDRNSSIKNMTINNDLTINVGQEDVYLVVEKLIIDADLNVSGKGKLNIYVTDSLSFGSNDIHIGQGAELNQINLLYSESNDININNNLILNGSMFLKEADINITGNLTVRGLLLLGAKKMGDNNNMTTPNANHKGYVNASVIAPYAKVWIGNKSVVNGMIIADSVFMHNDTVVNASVLSSENKYPFSSDPLEDSNQNNNIDLIVTEPALEQ